MTAPNVPVQMVYFVCLAMLYALGLLPVLRTLAEWLSRWKPDSIEALTPWLRFIILLQYMSNRAHKLTQLVAVCEINAIKFIFFSLVLLKLKIRYHRAHNSVLAACRETTVWHRNTNRMHKRTTITFSTILPFLA